MKKLPKILLLVAALSGFTFSSCSDDGTDNGSSNNTTTPTTDRTLNYKSFCGTDYSNGAYCLAATINSIKGYTNDSLPEANGVISKVIAATQGIGTQTRTYLDTWTNYGYPKILPSGIAVASKLTEYGLSPEVYFTSSLYSPTLDQSANQLNIVSDTIVAQEKRFMSSKGITVNELGASATLQSFLTNSSKRNFIILVDDGSQYLAIYKKANGTYIFYDPVIALFYGPAMISGNTINCNDYYELDYAGVIIAYN